LKLTFVQSLIFLLRLNFYNKNSVAIHSESPLDLYRKKCSLLLFVSFRFSWYYVQHSSRVPKKLFLLLGGKRYEFSVCVYECLFVFVCVCVCVSLMCMSVMYIMYVFVCLCICVGRVCMSVCVWGGILMCLCILECLWVCEWESFNKKIYFYRLSIQSDLVNRGLCICEFANVKLV